MLYDYNETPDEPALLSSPIMTSSVPRYSTVGNDFVNVLHSPALFSRRAT